MFDKCLIGPMIETRFVINNRVLMYTKEDFHYFANLSDIFQNFAKRTKHAPPKSEMLQNDVI